MHGFKTLRYCQGTHCTECVLLDQLVRDDLRNVTRMTRTKALAYRLRIALLAGIQVRCFSLLLLHT